MHQSVGNSLCVVRQWTPPARINDANTLVDMALANAIYATRASYNSGLRTTLGAMVFHQDMIMNIPCVADLELISEHQQQLIFTQLIVQNQKHISFDSQPGQEVLNTNQSNWKLEQQVHTKSMWFIQVTIQLTPYTIEGISIQQVKPFKH
jgi:hypothetical protein